ncbi:MAG: hypothetical protein JRJ77_16005 [Deltaproteobacteria bacterium]|nr:hypothetical protein [Deltaproteobacteria bacterium]
MGGKKEARRHLSHNVHIVIASVSEAISNYLIFRIRGFNAIIIKFRSRFLKWLDACMFGQKGIMLFTLTLQKPRMLQIQGVKGEAVVNYAEPLTTQEMQYHRLSRRVNNKPKKALYIHSTGSDFLY